MAPSMVPLWGIGHFSRKRNLNLPESVTSVTTPDGYYPTAYTLRSYCRNSTQLRYN